MSFYTTPGSSGQTVMTISSQTANFTATANTIYQVSAASGSLTVTLPTSAANQQIVVKKTESSGNTVTLSGTINGSSTTYVIRLAGQSKRMYADGSGGWLFIDGDLDMTLLATLASPTFTGTPTSPTPTIGTSTTQIATAAMVTTAQSSVVAINSQTANYTPVLTDAGAFLIYSSTSAGTFTIPPNSSVAYPVGTVLIFCINSTGALTIAPGSGVTLQTPAGLRLTTQFAQATATQITANQWYVSGQTVT